MRTKYDLFIDGRFTEPRTKSYLPDISPWNGKTIAEVAAASREDIDDAVLSAVKAQETWSLVFPAGRERVLLKAAELMEENAEDYASFIAEESGGTLMKGRNEVQGAAGSFITAAGECRRIYGNVIPSGWNSHLSVAVRVPRGVVAAIGPYNFPLGLLAGKAAYAVAAGNGAVLKSSSATPVAAYIIAEVLFKAGVPAGLVNAVSGPGDTIGDALVGHPLVDMVSFTGSTEAGRRINMRASQTFKKVCLEMGGKSPMLVLRDADVDDAVQKAAAGIFMHQGQVCMANSRIIVEAPVFGPLCGKTEGRGGEAEARLRKRQGCGYRAHYLPKAAGENRRACPRRSE
jgi:aldehyde dehydrogenase (NAD+)